MSAATARWVHVTAARIRETIVALRRVLIQTRRDLLAINADLERQVAERTASLETARNDLRTILDAMPAMIAYWDRNLINRFANRANEVRFGAQPGMLAGKHAREMLGEEQFYRELPHIEATLRGEVQTFEQSFARPDGSGFRHSLTHYVPDVKDGLVRGFYVLVHDVSESTENRLQLAGALRDHEALFRTLNLHSKVSVTDNKGYLVDVNENFCRVHGYTRDELLGHPHSIVKSGLHSREFWARMWDTIASGHPWRGEICNRAKDGTLHWVDSIIAPFVGKDGRVEKYVSIATSITAAKLTEHKLRRNEAFLERIEAVSGVGGWELDIRRRSVTWSPQMYRIYEVDSTYVPDAESEMSFYLPEVRSTIEAAISKCIERGTPWDLELPAVTAKGRAIWVRTSGVAASQPGAPVRLIGALQDVTARKRIEVELQRSSERFAIAADSAGIGVWELDAVNDRLTWDNWMYRIYGIPLDRKIAGRTAWLDTVHSEDRQRLKAHLQNAFRGPKDFNAEFRITRPDGEVRYIKAAYRAVRGADGTILRMTGVNFDVTEARLSELGARRETASLLRTVLDAASEVSIIATDEHLMIKVFNAGAERLLGYSSEEVVGIESLTQMHDPGELEDRSQKLSAKLGRRIDPRGTIIDPSLLCQPHVRTYVRKDGTPITVSLFVSAMRSDDGGILGYVCVAHDITQQNLDQRALLQAIDKAEQANNAKSLFLANMSHEIRTPMNAVIGLSYLMGHTALTEEQSSFLAKIQVASKSLLSIITNILDLSKIEAGELLLESTVFSVPDLLRDVAAVMTVHADVKGIRFVLDAPDDLPEALVGDATRLKQIFINLLSNAIRFTERGSVLLSVRHSADTSKGVTLSFAVTDTGIGIAPEAQAALFAPFAQADASISRRFGGTGLGLSIVKQLTKLLGGTVELESAVGVGSTVTVVFTLLPGTIDALAAARAASIVHGQGALQGVRALVVDDSDINLEVARRILELDGVHVTLAIDGQKAVEYLQADPRAFDVVFMDLQMPVLDGYEAARRIRQELGLANLPIIAVTAGALSSERQRAEDVGMDDFICKPFDGPTLAQAILRHIRPAGIDEDAETGVQRLLPSVPWPDIDGIDAADASTRWCGDVDLFLSMLERLVEEFRQVNVSIDLRDRQAVAVRVSGMHKLRGGACLLGAKAVYALAGELEGAYISGEFDRAADMTIQLAGEMQRLCESAQPAWMAARERSPEFAGIADPPLRIRELDLLLRQQSPAAVDCFRDLAVHLQRVMEEDSYERLRQHIDNLQFDEASGELLECAQRGNAGADGCSPGSMNAVN